MSTRNLFRSFLILTFTFFTATGLRAQGEANVWCFGLAGMLDFNSGSPVSATNSSISTTEGCASISDANGTLLFYTDGITAWNANHATMTNGTGLMGNASSSQSAIIVPKPNSPDIYYIFTVPAGCGTFGAGLRYSEVDMTLSAGLGAITTNKNIQLNPSTCEKVTAVQHSNGTDIWVICQSATTSINTYLVTSGGVNTTAVVSTAASAPTWYGYMKASPDGTRVVRAGLAPAEVFNFNSGTGILTPDFLIPLSTGGSSNYGVEFSVSGNTLYLSEAGLNAGVYQVDMSLGSAAAIIASKTFIGNNGSFGRYPIQIGPDSKIYVGDIYLTSVGDIEYPDSLGTSCGYTPFAIPLNIGSTCRLGFPTFIQSFFLPTSVTVQDTCFNDSTQFTAYNPQQDSVLWDFGDPSSGSSNYDQGDSVFHVFTAPGIYDVVVTTFFTNTTGLFGFVDTLFDTVAVTIHPQPAIDLGNDTILCEGDSLELVNSNTVLSMTYLWSNSSTTESIPVFDADTFWVEVNTLCGTAYDTIIIDSILPAIVDLGPDSILCTGDTHILNVNVAAGNYLWQDNDTTSAYTVTTTGMYHVTASGACNTSIDTVQLYFVDPPQVLFPADTTFCNGQTTDLVVVADSATFLWHDSSTDSIYTASVTETAFITTTNACGVFVDSSVIYIDFPLNNYLGPDTVVCEGNEYNLSPQFPGVVSYLWVNGTNGDNYDVDAPGKYWLEVTNTCGSYPDTLEVDYEVVPDISLPSRILLCDGETYRAAVPFSRSTYLWSTGSQSEQIDIGQAGWYDVTVTNLCGQDVDSLLMVVDYPLDIDLGSTVDMCAGDTVKFDVTSPNDPLYEWNDKGATPVLIVSSQGFYSVTVTNTCGAYSDEVAIYVQQKPRASLPADTLLCAAKPWEIRLPQKYAAYEWQDGTKSTNYQIDTAGTFWLKMENDCGWSTDTIHVKYSSAPVIDLGIDTFICPSISSLMLYAGEHEGAAYLWQDGSQKSTLEVKESGNYQVEVTNADGCSFDEHVFVDDCPVLIWIPSAFSPNSDRVNDVFLPKLSYVTEYSLTIYDRWGHKLFATKNLDEGWDGTVGAEMQPGGVYTYSLDFKSDEIGPQQMKGAVTLIR